MNGRTDVVRHIEKCEKCQQRQERMNQCWMESTADKLEREIEICYTESELKDEDLI